MKTLLEFMLAEPTCTSPTDVEGVGEAVGVLVGVGIGEGVGVLVGVGEGAGEGTGAGVGPVERQTEGCPLHANPICIWQLRQPGEGLLPVSQVSPPTISPSPHVGLQTPWLFTENPLLAHVIH